MGSERDNQWRQEGSPIARTQVSAGAPSEEPAPRSKATSRGGTRDVVSDRAAGEAVGETHPLGSPTSASSVGFSLVPGSLLDERFEVMERAGSGGMADVYRALDLHSGHFVALKVLRDTAPSLERFEQEATLLSEVRHPAIAAYVTHGRLDEDGAPYLAMEWLEGCSLESLLKQERLSVRDSVDLVRRVAAALEVVHQQGIVHRDINPSNLFLVDGRPQEVRILDFGVAHFASGAKQLTNVGDRLGTPGYMAPEQAQGNLDVGPTADVFALGCVLFECLTGKRAFTGNTLLEVFAKILAEQVPPPSTLQREVPPALDDLVVRMLAKAPQERPTSAGEVARHLGLLTNLSDVPPRSEPRSSAAVTASEQRISCVILTRSGTEEAFQQAERAAQLHGVRPSRLADGTIVALISGRGSATDQVAQAARCAVAIQESMHAPAVALATGLAVNTGDGPSGRAIEAASTALLHLESKLAEGEGGRRGTVWIDETTATLLDSRFDVRSTDLGFLLRGTRQTLEPTRTVLGRQTRCVGRKRELSLLGATFDECREEGVANIVLVTGPPGIGKSRLAHEFTRQLRRSHASVEILWGGGDPMSVGSPFSILIEAIQRTSHIADGEPLPARRHKLQERLRRVVAPAELGRITEFMGELIGTPFDDVNPQLRAARQDAVLRGDQILRAFEDWLAAECAQHPTVLILDDFHWGDLPTVKFIDSALRNLAEHPLMVVVLARPEVHELFPKLWSQRGVSELRLSGLTRRASADLVREILGPHVEPLVTNRVIERAQGNPFWLEELLRAEASGSGDSVPDRILLLAQSRLEQLDSDARRVLRAASVFGQRFWVGGVQELIGPEGLLRGLDAVLRVLAEEELLSERLTSRFPGQRELEFRSGLVRDAAYAALTDADRCRGHRLAAAWLEQSGESEALPLATHYAMGGQPERAVPHYRRAALQALSGNDLGAAIERAMLGLNAGASGTEAAALRLIQAEASKWQGNNAEAKRYARGALELTPETTPEWCLAAAEAAVAAGKLGDRAECITLSERLLEVEANEDNERELTIALSRVATQLVLSGAADLAGEILARATRVSDQLHPDPGMLGWLLEARAVLAGATDNPVGRMDLAEAAANRFEEAGDLRNACLQRVSLGFAQVEFGAFAEAERWLREALTVAERMALSNTVPIARAQLGRAVAHQPGADAAQGSLEEALALQNQAVAAFDQQGNLRLAGMARVYLAQSHLSLGQLEAAEAAARRAVEVLESSLPMQRSALAALALVHVAQERPAEALEAATRANAGLGIEQHLPVGECLVRLSLAEALLANGRQDEAVASARAARARIDVLTRGILDVDRRRQYLMDSPDRRRILELAAG